MAIERVDHRTYTPQGQTWDDAQRADFFGKLQQGQAVEGRQGFTWQHDGGGWAMSDQGAVNGPNGGAAPPPAPPAPGQGPTTPPGEPQRPSALPPSPPPAQTPAPQIPLGSTTPTSQAPAVPHDPNATSATPLVDANAQAPPAPDPISEAFRAAILQALGQNLNAADVTDADIAPQSRAFRAAQERAALKSHAALAEQASAEGLGDSEATRAAGRAIGERAEQAIGANDAALIGQKLQSRRDQLNAALQIANARGMQQESNDLQRQIANLDAQLKQQGIDVTREGYQLQRDLAGLDTNTKQYLADLDAKLREQGYGVQERLAQLDAEIRKLGINTQGNLGQLELALRRELGIGQLNLDLLGLQLQDKQASNKLGFDIGQWQSILNKDSLLAALNG